MYPCALVSECMHKAFLEGLKIRCYWSDSRIIEADDRSSSFVVIPFVLLLLDM